MSLKRHNSMNLVLPFLCECNLEDTLQFWVQIGPLTTTRYFFRKTINFHLVFGLLYYSKLQKQFLEQIQSSGPNIHFQVQNGPFAQNNVFFWKNHLTNFHVTLNPFHYAIFQKKSIEWIQSYDKMPFSGQNKPFAPNEIFFRKTINISFMYLLVPFIVQNFKKILRVNPELRECSTFGPKMAQLPKMNFFFQKNR